MKLPRLTLRRRAPTTPAPDTTETGAGTETPTRKAKASTPAKAGLSRFNLKMPLGGGNWLLLAWDVAGLHAVIAEGDKQRCTILARAESHEAQFPAALADVLEQLDASGAKRPRRAALAARQMRPAVVDLPVHPDKPRPATQMRELLRSDLEPALAEFGGLWTMGALLFARGHLSAADRDRVVLEETLRREDRRTPLRYGETALELALIDRATLNECLELQEQLQYLDGELLSAWKGRVEHGERHWLAAGVTARMYRQWSDALAVQRIRLDVVLPLAWLASDPGAYAAVPNEPGISGEVQQLALELHSEEVVAVRRQHGQIVAARTEGRMERPLQSDWLQRLIEEWSSEARAEIVLACLDTGDEAATRQVANDLELTSGHPVRVVPAAESWAVLWPALLREAVTAVPEHRLPRLAARELRGKPWKNPDLLRLAALLGVVLVLVATEGWQRYQLGRLRQTVSQMAKKESEQQQLSQQTSKANAETQQVAKELQAVRTELEPLLNEHARLEAIAAMRQYLPDLMLMLGQSVGNDAVLEKVGNARSGSDATAIRVEAWSPSYTGAQDFVNRVAEQIAVLSYGVAQTEIREERGRTDQPGYRVGFWLVQEPDELEQPDSPPANTSRPAPGATGISSQAKGTP